ncbi:hypothetical protein [Shewanella woodyi]|uniref:DUF4440 domain-containing protein n=1 Tax=Shewanella woodyi (strain ATCC 51908 / MS32) TaxID=392500 RepID=B1KFH8_SHEWM|nr:hypothetical protein [Shewanella woodyi]ACA88153.1 hypothetical protein Swoo_3895 [Shewanella woodyi ATCC 51908]
MRFIVICIALIVTFGAHASDFDKIVKNYTAAVNSNDFELVAELLHPNELDLLKEKVDGSLQSSNKSSADKGLLRLLGVDSRQQAFKLTPKDVYIRICNNLMARYPNEALEIAIASSIYLGEERHDDIVVVTYKMTYNTGDEPVTRIVQHRLKEYKDSWRFLLTPETLAYFGL